MNLAQGKVLVIANPAAKNGEGAKAAYHVRRLLREALGASCVDEVHTQSPGHASLLAAGASGKYATVVAVGGDGVIHEVANGLMEADFAQRPALGIVPVGSGNDYARTLHMSEDVEEAVGQLLRIQTRMLDVGKVNGEYFVETLSFGLDAAIALDTVERRKRTQKSGAALYFEAGIDQLLHHLDVYEIQAEFNNKLAVDIASIMFAVQIGQTYGGGFKICPDALPDNGHLDICYATGAWSLPRAVVVFARAKNGKHIHAKGVHFEQVHTLQLHFKVPPPAQADGERVEGTNFFIEIVPQALNVFSATSV